MLAHFLCHFSSCTSQVLEKLGLFTRVRKILTSQVVWVKNSYLRYGKSGAPLLLQNIKAYAAIAVDIWVKNLCPESHLKIHPNSTTEIYITLRKQRKQRNHNDSNNDSNISFSTVFLNRISYKLWIKLFFSTIKLFQNLWIKVFHLHCILKNCIPI